MTQPPASGSSSTKPRRLRRRYVPDWPNYGTRRRRLSRGTLLLGALILVLAVVAGELRPGEQPPPATPGALALVELDSGWFAATPLAARADATRVDVDRVIDGDTVDVRASGELLRVRVFGIDTSERGEPCFAEASARTAALVAREVLLVPDEGPEARLQDRSGRELRYLFALDGRSIDATLVAEGLARAWREDGALRARLVAIEDAAREARRGCLWS